MAWLKEFAPKAKRVNKVQPSILTVELFPRFSEAGTPEGWLACLWDCRMPVVETKKCPHVRTVTLSNGKLKVVAHLFKLDMLNSDLANIVRQIVNNRE